MNDRALLTAPVIGREFALQLRRRRGGDEPKVACELAEVQDTFGPAMTIRVRWDRFWAHVPHGRTALAMSLEDYSRLFVQPVVEEWIRDMQRFG